MNNSENNTNDIPLEQALESIHKLIVSLENDGTTLERSIELYEEATSLIKRSQKLLSIAEQTVNNLLETDNPSKVIKQRADL
ncbi:hypothetical protein A3709_10895 [Halioglobus sp. HI00S01]|uniref:exodeoxyribonuclease VII small subunit n=1 Tax=Halioglobus sp. HI00S01 TaxID=1822214 RepID=UPI0007C3C248|nr:hypothetical protein A3709_10895 [Halioglobus sp. HI00S01]